MNNEQITAEVARLRKLHQKTLKANGLIQLKSLCKDGGAVIDFLGETYNMMALIEALMLERI